jgi:hypothetical protein
MCCLNWAKVLLCWCRQLKVGWMRLLLLTSGRCVRCGCNEHCAMQRLSLWLLACVHW